jgi:hypothetical protein
MPHTPFIDDDLATFLLSGISISPGSRSVALVPSVTRAVGARLSPDRSRVTVLVRPSQGEEFLADVRATGHIAVVFSEPSSHRTVQLKGEDALVEAPVPGDAAIAERHRAEFSKCLADLGYSPDLGRLLLEGAANDLAAVAFTVMAAFVQTPGPAAGQALSPAR